MSESEVMPPPSMGGKLQNGFIRGIIRKDEDFIMVLDIDKIFSNDDLIDLKTQLQGAGAKMNIEKL